MRKNLALVTSWIVFLVLVLAGGHAFAQSNSPPSAVQTAPIAAGPNTADNGTNSPVKLPEMVVTAHLDAAREQIAPSLGAVT